MLCGYLKQTCKSITVQQLINILKTCKDPNAIIKMNDMTNFYIHFDIDGQFINLTKLPCANDYGECGIDNTCSRCNRHDNKQNCCKCDGKDCINASSMVDTEKFNELASKENTAQETTKSQASITQNKNDEYKLDNKYIESTINSAISKALEKMINSLKG